MWNCKGFIIGNEDINFPPPFRNSQTSMDVFDRIMDSIDKHIGFGPTTMTIDLEDKEVIAWFPKPVPDGNVLIQIINHYLHSDDEFIPSDD